MSLSNTSALLRCAPQKKRLSRVSFASLDGMDGLSSPEKEAGETSDDLPPSPCRAQRQKRLSFSKEAILSDVSDACSIANALPSSPPDSPGRYQQVWLCMRQREEELEDKQRQLEEWDFELQEEKRQHKESRLFLARKMSELEARELRAAKEEERRLSRVSTLSGSQTSSIERTPPSSKTRTHLLDTPPHGSKLSDIVESSTQTEDCCNSALGDTRQHKRKCTCRWLVSFGIVLLIVLKICVLVGIVLAPELSSQTVENVAAWLPVSFEKSVSPDAWNEDEAAGGNCSTVLDETRLMLATLHQKHHELQQKHVTRWCIEGPQSWQAASLWARSLFGWA